MFAKYFEKWFQYHVCELSCKCKKCKKKIFWNKMVAQQLSKKQRFFLVKIHKTNIARAQIQRIRGIAEENDCRR